MIFHETTLKDAWLIEPELRGDERGSFARTMCRDEFARYGLATDYVQQNMSVSATAGTIRGMHFQRRPYTEAKLVRCVRGAILDVIVDLRTNSPTYLRHEGFELTAENHRQLYVPPGFAHAFQTLVDDIEVSYLVSAPYTPEAEGGVRYNDPLLGIKWPLPVSVISEKDANWPLLTAEGPGMF
ncbi:dTDP-4-dehydrorhamnose 3,5-epimerase [Rhizorhapis suberifaciens]|uniref:dTDP-4-dehydrorhamnose 3,5-epimerase n=1 Tax=Rhizorhapis suberifaciens TaxID=13656 RepID=A0A840HUP1_9SPHN|nr:dTDP-4-dehydrorhamnose 3,5-epimerase [Rhizorhapis suberifaciens]MBB4641401.1 dTDP-4-dehydrorhamnose 3,5-epimerase [Rhizorhapis suberifaciens]